LCTTKDHCIPDCALQMFFSPQLTHMHAKLDAVSMWN